MNRLTAVFVIIAAGLLVLVFNHDGGKTFGMDSDRFARLLYLLPIAALLSVGILRGRRGSLHTVVQQLAVWLVIILACVAAYLYQNDAKAFVARMTAGLLPGKAVVVTAADGNQEVVIHKAMGGHFRANVSVDDKVIPMLVDTGASSVVLSYEDAGKLGIDLAPLRFSLDVATANGMARAAPIRLQSVAIGPITRTNVRAMVTEPDRLDESLLGMSFLSTLGSLEIKSDELRLQD